MVADPEIKIKLIVGDFDETQKLIKTAIRYIREDADTLEESYKNPGTGEISPESTAREIRAKRRWIQKAEAWLASDTSMLKGLDKMLKINPYAREAFKKLPITTSRRRKRKGRS